ncbi:hypothetical protein OS188_09005 [Xanthomarina sp. F1114]|jgi:hypothetical protein|uniref:hypothetical protein n=1 Tax=Xanthomarina sp. F1114 TaxID=2996019 RepID=UPI00225E0557|nr:hypothetical protein [Xanthomarina sp. F1114]MCX7548089.1 hypothetical protein [Xanthomarina sp. F1114]
MKYLCFIFCLISLSAFSQIDSSQESTSIPAVESDKGTEGESLFESKPIENRGLGSSNSDRINGLSVPKQNELSNPNEQGFSMFGGEKFGNPAELYTKQLDRHNQNTMEESGSNRQYGSTTNQYLGDFKTGVSRVNIVYRDHQYPDGDRVRIFVNDDVVISNVTLQSSFSGFQLDLVEGFNKIDFLALNQGSSGPNTAELQVMDDDGNVIASGAWNLATGVKATLIVIKE